MKKIALVLLAAFVLLLAVMLVQTARFGEAQGEAPAAAGYTASAAAAERLAEAIRIPTVFTQDSARVTRRRSWRGSSGAGWVPEGRPRAWAG